MVQIIQEGGYSPGKGLSGGFLSALGMAPELMAKQKESKLKKEEIASKLKLLEQPEYQEFFKGVDPRLSKLATLAAAGVIDPGVATSMAELIRQGQSDIEFKNALEGTAGQTPTKTEEPLSTSPAETKQPTQEPPAKKPGKDYEGQISKLQKALQFATTPQKRAQVESQIKELQREQAQEIKRFESERKYHTQFSKPIEENVAKLRESIPRKENALNLSRQAIESGDLEFFSPDKLADATGLDLFRTSKGAQLITAGKENLLSNMSRASAKAQNMWFEQRLNTMFPKIGQSQEANLTVQEMIEGELAMDKVYQEMFDKLSSQDEENFGYVRKDIDKRTHEAIKDEENKIFNRTNYRLKELEEQELGLEQVRKKVGKNVVKGTPLTLGMAKLYKDKFGENAFQIAKKNGYYIPSLEEFKIFQERPQEFREGFAE